jgi:hypothetical protein
VTIALFACGRGHQVAAWLDEKNVDLAGYFCPLCMGGVVGAEDMIDSRILAPVQESIMDEKP